MKKTKKLLSLLTALTITASAFASLVIPASAESTVYVDENFDSYDAGEIIRAGTTEPPASVKKGDITYSAGNRKDGLTNTASIAAMGEGNELVISADRFSTSNRGIALTFEPEAAIPQVSALDAGEVLKLSAKIKATAGFTVVGYGDITGTDLTNTSDYVYVSVILDNEGGKKYLVVRDANNNTLNMLESDLGDIKTISGISFCLGAGAYNIDDIKVETTSKEGEVPQEKFYNVTIKTESYAKIVYQIDSDPEKTTYADVDGSIEIPNVKGGSSFTYTASKEDYTFDGGVTESTDTVTIEDHTTITVPAMTLTKDLGISADDLVYYENTFGEGSMSMAKSDRLSYKLLKKIDLPEVSTMSFTLSVSDKERTQATIMIKNKNATDVTKKDDTDIIGFQSITADDTLVAFTGFKGDNGSAQSGLNQYNAVGAYTNSAVIADRATGTFDIEVILSQSGDVITVKCDGKTVNLPKVNDISSLGAIHMGKHENAAQVTLDDFLVYKPDENFVSMAGDTEFAKIAGKTVTRTYSVSPAIPVEGETFTWSVSEMAGVSIDQNGVLSVEDTAAAGTVTVSAVSSVSADKKGELEVNIRDFANLIPTVEYPKVMNIGESAKLKVTQIVDQYGDDVTEYFSPTWSIDDVPSLDTDVTFDTTDKTGNAVAISAVKENGILQSISTQNVTISGNETIVTAEGGSTVMLWDSLEGMLPLAAPQIAPEAAIGEDVIAVVSAKTGTIKANNVGDVTVKLTLREGQEPEQYRIDIGNYYKVLDYSEVVDNQVDISDLAEDESVTGYQVTVADADGGKLAQEVVQAVDVKVAVPAVETGTPAKVEVAPVYTTTAESELLIPAETYNITLKTNTAGRADLYVNDQIIVNNINQDSQNFTVKGSFPATTYSFGDIKIAEGYAQFNYRDNQSGNKPIDEVVIVKAPSIVKRATRVYVIGDSLVATYHDHEGVEESKKNLVRQGWGEALKHYIKDAEVTNLGNSGATSDGMLGVAFTQVRASGQAGDILVLEGGYNDKSVPLMKDSIKQMVIEAEKKGITVFVVPPNASTHSENEYKGNVKSHAGVKDAVNELKSAGYHPILIDLSTNSSKFFERNYGAYATVSTDETKWNNIRDTYNNSADTLHSTVNAANAWAAVVAKGIYDNEPTRKYVDTDYSFTITDANDSNHQVVVSALTVN
jgi:lysophospholipase L1-like esterase